MRLIKKDTILIGLIIFISVVLLLFTININQEKGAKVLVIVDGKTKESFPLSNDIEYNITIENDSFNLLVIKDGFAYIKESDCKDNICVNHKKIHLIDETIICLPHKLVIQISK